MNGKSFLIFVLNYFMNLPETTKKRVVIIGAGFAGISLAKKLRKLPVQVVVIDKHNYHTFQPLLYQVSTGGLEPDSIAYPIRKILKRLHNFYFRLATVTKLNPELKEVHTDIGKIPYDYLVIATGTRTNYFGNTEIQENAMSMKSVPQALDLRSYLLQNFEAASTALSEENIEEMKRRERVEIRSKLMDFESLSESEVASLLKQMIELEKYYKKDEWENLVLLYNDKWIDSDFQIRLINTLNGNKDLAIVIWGEFKESAFNWIDKKIPALDNIKPIDCINDEKLINRLKVCLLRLP